MGADTGTRRNFEPGVKAAKPEVAKKHRRWIVHSHEATRPKHVEAVSDINITPLIDVMLVLLIIFMVVTPLAQKGLDIALPQPTRPTRPRRRRHQSNQVVLGIEESPSGDILTVNKSPVATMDELEQRLRDIFQTRSDKTIFVRASGPSSTARWWRPWTSPGAPASSASGSSPRR